MNECSILWCGKYHQNWENELHCHNYFQMVGILSGSGTVYVDLMRLKRSRCFCCAPSSCTPSTAVKKTLRR